MNISPGIEGESTVAGHRGRHEALGMGLVFASAFSLYFATVAIRWAKSEVELEAGFFVFSRFLLGFVVLLSIYLYKRSLPRPKEYRFLAARIITNVFAVFCFYEAVNTSSLAVANILNMTYPVFIALFSFFVFRSARDLGAYIMSGIAVIGVVLVLDVGNDINRVGSFWALSSAVLAAVSLIVLNLTRQQNDADTVLFYLFGVGMLISYAVFYRDIYFPSRTEAYYLFLAASSGTLGMACLTAGFRHVTAAEGGVISSTRILLASFWGMGGIPLSRSTSA